MRTVPRRAPGRAVALAVAAVLAMPAALALGGCSSGGSGSGSGPGALPAATAGAGGTASAGRTGGTAGTGGTGAASGTPGPAGTTGGRTSAGTTASAGTPAGTSAATSAGQAAGGAGRQAAPARPWNTRPPSVAALGDSITRGFDACHPFEDCPEVSWATGTRAGVSSVSARLGAGTRTWNLARSGAHVADLPRQARAAAAHHPAMVTVLIGANDACAPTLGAMTTVADFRASFSRALSYLHRALPGTQVLVASVPDLEHLWSVGRSDVVESQLWRLGLCPTMLSDPDSTTPAATARRTAVRERVVAYNTVLSQECARYPRCRYDGGAVFRFPFGTGQLSTWDWFHPNAAGQAELARVLSAVVRATSG